jgi:hypothetical protein
VGRAGAAPAFGEIAPSKSKPEAVAPGAFAQLCLAPRRNTRTGVYSQAQALRPGETCEPEYEARPSP